MTCRQKLAAAQAQILSLEQQLAAARQAVADWVTIAAAKDGTITDLLAEIDRLQGQLDVTYLRATELQTELDAANARIAELEAQVVVVPSDPPPVLPTRILGAWTEFNRDGVWSLAENKQFDTLTGAKMAGSMHYATWQDSGIQAELVSAYDAGRTLVHTAWPAWKGGWPADAIDGIISGKYDSVIRAMAQKLEAARQGRAMQWRPFWEMNGAWMPWNAAKTGNDPTKFKQMFRRVVEVGRAAGYGGQFVWSPNAYSSTHDTWNALSAYWPGDDVVDVVGVSAYNGYTANQVPWRPFSDIVFAVENIATAHDKPLMMSEGSSIEDPATPGRKAAWIRAMFDYLAATPRWETILWFHRPATSAEAKDYRVDSSASSLDAWREVALGPWPQPPLVSA